MTDTLIYICGALVIVGGAILSYLGISGSLKNQRGFGLLVLFLTIVFVLAGVFLYLYKLMNDAPAPNQPRKAARAEIAVDYFNVIHLAEGKQPRMSFQVFRI